MKYRITAKFGPYRFTADCESVAAAFHHVEAIIMSPMFTAAPERKEESCSAYLLCLADLAEKRETVFETGVFRVEAISEGRRRG